MEPQLIFNLNKLFFILFLIAANSYGQFYADFGIDPNKAFGIIDNPRTKDDHRGFHFDVEAGALLNHIGVYLLYGRFAAADYQKAATGVDYYFLQNNRFSLAAGSAASMIFRTSEPGSRFQLAWSVRTTTVYYILPQVGLSGNFQYQRRPDIEVAGILEGKIGVRFKI